MNSPPGKGSVSEAGLKSGRKRKAKLGPRANRDNTAGNARQYVRSCFSHHKYKADVDSVDEVDFVQEGKSGGSLLRTSTSFQRIPPRLMGSGFFHVVLPGD